MEKDSSDLPILPLAGMAGYPQPPIGQKEDFLFFFHDGLALLFASLLADGIKPFFFQKLRNKGPFLNVFDHHIFAFFLSHLLILIISVTIIRECIYS